MPPTEPRKIINFRLSQAGHIWVNDLAVELGVDRTSVFRAVMAVARNHEAETKMILRQMKETQ